MSLEYVFDGNKELISLVMGQGYDVDSLCFMCKDMFVLFEDLGMQSQSVSELIKNLKIVHNVNTGKQNTLENEDIPLKITVTNTLTHKLFTFHLFSGQGLDPYYTCDLCKKNLFKSDIKTHVLDHESN